jgi:hypothetical protein
MLRRELFPHEGRQDAPSSVSYEAVVELAPGEPSDDEQLEREFLESAPPMDELQWGGTTLHLLLLLRRRPSSSLFLIHF